MAAQLFEKVMALANRANVAALLVPYRVARAIADQLFPDAASDASARSSKESYLEDVAAGGFIGMLLDKPMIVARDVVLCSLSERELGEAATRLGVDVEEIERHKRGVLFVPASVDS